MAAFTNVTLVPDTSDLIPYLGAGIDAAYTVAMQDDVGMDAEAFLCCLFRYDVVTNFASLTTNGKRILGEYVCRAMALAGIAYNMNASFTSRIEAENMMNVHIWRLMQIENILSNSKVWKYLGIPV